MKNVIIIISAFVLSFGFVGCDSASQGPSMSGQITGSENMKLFLDVLGLNQPSSPILNTKIDKDGNFKLPLPNPLNPGVYRVRIGAKRFNLVLDGSETNVKITGDLNNIERYDFQLDGAPVAESLRKTLNKMASKSLSLEQAKAAINNASDPMVSMMIAFMGFGNNPQFIDIHKGIKPKLKSKYPGTTFSGDYDTFINDLIQKKKIADAGKIKVGTKAPEIELPSPDGTVYKLSDLKGKVVLLDFWASWCRPCRMENPNVVRVYDKYNNKGFEVFSVSLDKSTQKNRWVDAIAKDNLKWKYHVSDLKFWQSAPAQMYGVKSIPKTFLIDRDGNIAAVGLRGAANIEKALKELL